MTLEKLLIFGFALSAVTAIVFLADNTSGTRGDQKDNWKTEVGKVAEKAK